MPDLLSLPTEILQEITRDIPNDDRKSLRTLCSRLRDPVGPQLFYHLNIPIYPIPHMNKAVEGLAKPNFVSEHVRSISIHHGKYYLDWSDTSNRRLNKTVLLEIQRPVFLAISSLRFLRQFKWCISGAEPLWSREPIFDALASLEHLSDFSFSIERYLGESRDPFPLDRLRGLERISITAPAALRNTWVSAKQLVAQCPDLRHLVLRHADKLMPPVNHCLRLAEVLNSGSSHLTELHIDGWYITPAFLQPCIARLRSLTTLVVGERPQDQDDLWLTLASGRIFMPTLDVVNVRPSLVAYLSSHPGLQELRLGGHGHGLNSFVGASERLFLALLPHHADSLKQLTIAPLPHDPEWCFDAMRAKYISKFTNLNRLTVTFNPDLATHSITVTLLLNAISSLPLLTMVTIDYHGGVIWPYITKFNPIHPGTFHPSLEIVVGRNTLRLGCTKGTLKFYLVQELDIPKPKTSTPRIARAKSARKTKVLDKFQKLKRRILDKL